MSPAQIHLAKTLCAMRWIALLTGRHDVAKAIEYDQAQTKGGAA
ncbi:hypothetical protein [Limnohabitans sp. WS1]|nr:hypothetical protein [Limnohabitans sp. WS1]